MNYRVDRGGRVAVACGEGRVAEARRVCAAINKYRPPAEIGEMQTEIGFAALNLEAALLPRPRNAQQMDLPSEARHLLRDADHLIVLCDAAALEDRFVDEEIRTFLAHHTGRRAQGRLHPLTFGGGENAPLPEAIREAGAAPIADLGDGKDGWTKGLTVIRAAVLGVSPALLEKLEQDRSRRRAISTLWAIGGVAAAATVAAVAVSG